MVAKKSFTQRGMEEVLSNKEVLKYLFFKSDNNTRFTFSFNPKDSDIIQNSTLLSGLVATLVKYSTNGKIEPYLAESFVVENDLKTWKFKIRDGYKCENGEIITANSYVENLTRSLFRYANSGDVLDFENLEGWPSNSKLAIGGLYADQNEVIMKFKKAPSDLLEFLRMPYFGYWCVDNFNEKNEWKDNHKIISSGAYQLDMTANSASVRLKRRDDSKLSTSKSPKRIIFDTFSDKELNEKTAIPTIFQFSRKKEVNVFNNDLRLVSAPPTMLFTIALSPYFHGIFKDKSNRQIFRDKLDRYRDKFKRFNSTYFYFNASSPLDQRDKSNLNFNTTGFSKVIKFAVATKSFTNLDLDEVSELLKLIFQGSGLKYEIIVNDAHENDWLAKVDSNIEFDARITSVDIGGHVINAAIKMMFCSKMGINFGDPSNEICNLVEKKDNLGGPISDEYVQNFNKIVYDQSIVIPLYHYGMEWYFTDDIDPSSVGIMSTEPKFEDIRFYE